MQQPPNQPYPQQPGQYPPYPQQPGQYPPNQPEQPFLYPAQPPKRKRLGVGCGIATGIVVAIIAIIVISASHGSQANTSSAGVTQKGSAPQSATSGPQAYEVGQSATLDGWVVIVNSAKSIQGGQFDSLKAGNIFLALDVSAKNETGSAQNFSSLLFFKLKDSTGQSYTETIVSSAPNAPNGNVPNGSPIRGTLTYEVPSTLKAFTLDFTPDITSTDTATWDITLK